MGWVLMSERELRVVEVLSSQDAGAYRQAEDGAQPDDLIRATKPGRSLGRIWVGCQIL